MLQQMTLRQMPDEHGAVRKLTCITNHDKYLSTGTKIELKEYPNEMWIVEENHLLPKGVTINRGWNNNI